VKANYDQFAQFYDLEYGHKENDIDFYLDVAEEIGAPVLEIGVGTGRIAIPLADEGFKVVGIDNSAEMIRLAQENLKDIPKEFAQNLILFQQDMKELELNQKFPLCIIPFRAFLHNLTQEDQLATLERIYQHLEPGGILTFDLFVPLYSVISNDEWLDDIEEDELAIENSGLTISTHVKHNPVKQLMEIKNTYKTETADNQIETNEASMTYRYVFRYEMEALLTAAGFETLHVWGGFEQQSYDYVSGIMVFVAQKSQ
jgi:SAM-dependent methyltransferase